MPHSQKKLLKVRSPASLKLYDNDRELTPMKIVKSVFLSMVANLNSISSENLVSNTAQPVNSQ